MVGKNALIKALSQTQSDLAANGITLLAPDVKVTGYPLRYRAALTDLSVEGPKGRYQTQRLNISADAFRPTQWTLSSDSTARIDMRGNSGERWLFDLSGQDMQVKLGHSLAGKLISVDMTMHDVIATPVIGDAPPITAIKSGTIKLTPSVAPLQSGTSAVFDIAGITLSPKAAGNLQRVFGSNITRIKGSGLATGLASLEPEDAALWKQSGALNVPDLVLDWGKAGFVGQLNLVMSAKQGETGGANGKAVLGVADADALMEAFVDAGILSQQQALAGAFFLMAAPRDDQDRIILTMPVQDNSLTLFGQTLHKF